MNMKITRQTYYEVLEVTPATPHHEVVAAYQRAKEAYSPDSIALYSMFSTEEANELRKLVEEAFQVLGNPAKRKAYDESLTGRVVASDLDMLPDFAPLSEMDLKPNPVENRQTYSMKPERTVMPAAAKAENQLPHDAIPAGFARSRVSVYELNPAIEAEIKNQQTYDGAFLKKIRQYKNINMDQMSKETRISRNYLLAIEEDDFSSLPAPVFLRGFIIQYARILGLNENLAATSYMSRVKKG